MIVNSFAIFCVQVLW